jgi:hypothetical protein
MITPASVFYPVGACNFAVSTDYLSVSPITSASSTGTCSFWLNATNITDASEQNIYSYSSGSALFAAVLEGSSNIGFKLFGAVSGQVQITSNSGSLTTNAWHHVMASWNTNFGAGSRILNLYVDGVNSLNIATDNGSAFSTWGVSSVAELTGGLHFHAISLAELYISNQFLDLSTLANQRKFITASKRPAFLGANGSLPTGTQPLIYLKGSGAGFNVNSGSGGNFTTTGTLTTPTTTPSQP